MFTDLDDHYTTAEGEPTSKEEQVKRLAATPDHIKQVIVLCTELGMRRGKMVAQGAHASVKAAMLSNAYIYNQWDIAGHKKVALKVKHQEELNGLYLLASEAGLPCALIIDQGLTQIPADSITAVAIGPDWSRKIDKITACLSLLQ